LKPHLQKKLLKKLQRKLLKKLRREDSRLRGKKWWW
jgi:hypothetical protein